MQATTSLSNMESKILKDKRIVLTRPDNKALAVKLQELGAKVIELPLIEVFLGCDEEVAADIFEGIACYEWITFSSANGVRGFFKAFFERFEDIRSIGPCRIATVGKATAEELKKFYIQTDVIANPSTSDAMAEAMMEYETIENLNILSVIGNLSDKSFAQKLEQKGRAIVDTFPVYTTKLIKLSENSAVVKDFVQNGADAIFFASSSAVEAFSNNARVLSLSDAARHPKAFSIGPKTTEAMKKFGIPVAKEAANPSEVLEMLKAALA